MGANQSNESRQTISGSTDQQGGILVVNPTPVGQQQEPLAHIRLPKRKPPIMSLESHHIDPSRHRPNKQQLNPELWRDLVVIINEFSKSRSEMTSQRQNQLQEKIVQVDEHVREFTDSYMNVKHKALARLKDDCHKMEEINKLLEKCTIQSELCVSMLNKLNFLLPDEHKLEPLEA